MADMVIFEEQFTDNRNAWFEGDDPQRSAKVELERYVFEHKRGEGHSWLSWKDCGDYYAQAGFRVQCVVEKISGVDNYGYGLVWGVENTSNFYDFLISGNGYYRIYQWIAGAYTAVVDWTRSDAIRTSNNLNLLELHLAGSELLFYINSLLVQRLPSQRVLKVAGRQTGFAVHDRVKIAVHSLVITAPDALNRAADQPSAADQTVAPAATPSAPEDTLEIVMAELEALIGLEGIKGAFRQLASFLKVQKVRRERGLKTPHLSLHLVLTGPPGTGKTTLARLVGRLYKQLGYLERGHVIETDRAGLVAGYIGQTALKTDELVTKADGGVLFIDEAYALAPENDGFRDFGYEAIETLLKRMEDARDRFAVVIAGYPAEMNQFLEANPGVKSRFNRYFTFAHFSAAELLVIFEKFAADNGYTIHAAARVKVSELIEAALSHSDQTFGNARYARNLFERILEQQSARVATNATTLSDADLSEIAPEDIPTRASLEPGKARVKPISFQR
jgi:AAA+ superfamily predicted ATPase